MSRPVCAVVGVGPGNGAAFARRFSQAGCAVALMARSTQFTEPLADELPLAKAYACDVTRTDDIEDAFYRVRADLGIVDVLIYNAGSGIWGNVEEVSAEEFELAWRINALGAFITSQQVIPGMKEQGRGSIVFIGATASLRGGANFSAFASAKAAQRNLAQSMARHLWPQGIHVALMIIDGMILPDAQAPMAGKEERDFLNPKDIADSVYAITTQKRSAWSFEFEARPFREKW